MSLMKIDETVEKSYTYYENAMIQGTAAGGAKKLDGSRQAQIVSPMKKS